MVMLIHGYYYVYIIVFRYLGGFSICIYMSLAILTLGLWLYKAGLIYLHHVNWTVATKSEVIMIQQPP